MADIGEKPIDQLTLEQVTDLRAMFKRVRTESLLPTSPFHQQAF